MRQQFRLKHKELIQVLNEKYDGLYGEIYQRILYKIKTFIKQADHCRYQIKYKEGQFKVNESIAGEKLFAFAVECWKMHLQNMMLVTI